MPRTRAPRPAITAAASESDIDAIADRVAQRVLDRLADAGVIQRRGVARARARSSDEETLRAMGLVRERK